MRDNEKATILLVDDQPAKLLSYEAMLKPLNEHLVTASSAREALLHLLQTEVAVVLVDVVMPELDGFELVALMREHPRFEKLPIIFVSGVLLSEIDRLKGYAAGAVDYVSVPVVPEILRAKVSVFVELYRKNRELERLNHELERRVAERTSELEASTRDLRDREEALREADRRKDEFLAMLAHEIRNPLAPIRTAVQLLRLVELPEAERIKAREVIERQVDHLVRLVDDLLDVARITRGAITLQRSRVSLAEVVERAAETARPSLTARKHELVFVLPPEAVYVDGDLTRLSQVVGNLLNNSAKYTEPHGRIEIGVESNGRDAVLYVRDNGIGIPPEMQARIFELFTQIDRALDRAHDGLGIGLALVKHLVEMHGGSVSATSRGIGTGTEVRVRLPLSQTEHVAAEQPALSESPPAGFERILIVDDNRDAADATAVSVTHAGYTARVAYDGHEALRLASTFCPAVVLLDLGMPGLNGLTLARRMRQLSTGQDMTLIAITGWGQAADRDRTAQAGFDAHLVKPVDRVHLLQTLNAHLRPRLRPNPQT